MCIKKLCNTCGRTLPLTNEHFAYKNKELGIFNSECKVCKREKAVENPNAKTANSERIEKMDERIGELRAITPTFCRH